MKKIALAFALLLIGATASPAWADAVISALGSAGAVSASDIIPDCQSCTTSAPMVGMTITQLDTYLDTLFLQRASNLSDLASAATARTNLGLGALATLSVLPLADLGGAVNGDCIVGSGGAWTAASCGSGGSVSITAGNTGIVLSPSPLTGTGTVSLGNPTLSALGGIEAVNSVSHEWVNSISTSGIPGLTQPAFTDISGSASSAQIATALTTPGPIGGTTPGAGNFTTLGATGNLTTNVTGSTQCLHANSSGVVSGTGSDCGSGGGGTPVVFTGTTAGTATAQTIASPTPSGYAFTAGYQVNATIGTGLSTTGATTLSVNGTTAYPEAKITDAGFVAVGSGDQAAGHQYTFIALASCPAPISSNCYVQLNSDNSAVSFGDSSPTVTAQQWSVGHLFVAPTGTITLPVVTSLSTNGGIFVATIGSGTVTLAPNAADGVNGGTIGATVSLPSNQMTVVTGTGTSGTGAIKAPLGLVAGSNVTLTPNANGTTTVASSGSGGSLTVTDGTHSVASTTTLTMGNRLVVGGTTPSATLNVTNTSRADASATPAIVSTDAAKTVYFTASSGSIAATIPATSVSGFGSGFATIVCTTTIQATLTPTSGTLVNGLAAITLPTWTCAGVSTDPSSTFYEAAISKPGTGIWSNQQTFTGGVLVPPATAITATGNIDPTAAANLCGNTVSYNSSSAGTLSVLSTWPVGCNVSVEAVGTGLATIAAGSGTVHSACTTVRTRAQYSVIWIRNEGTAGTVTVSGDCG